MTFNANYLDTDQSYENIMSPFDAMPPLHSSVQQEIITPISSILGTKTPAIAFTLDLFKARPELFGVYGTSLIYAQYSGTAYKPELVYGLFELFLTRTSPSELKARRTRKLGIYESDPDLLITWARLMQQTKTNIIFEPIMNNLGKVMNNWLQNRRVNWGGISYNINTFKSLMYNYCGENYLTLFPYICYLLTFMIHCRPFTFNEAQTESSTFGFYSALEAYYEFNYNELGKEFDLDIIHSSLEELNKIPSNYLKDFFKVMLNPDKIIEIRNTEIRKTENLLNECLTDQNSLSLEFVRKAWELTMSQMLKRVVAFNPIKNIFDSIPRYKQNFNLNIYELMDWTQYCLASGNKPFCIEPESYSELKGCQHNYPLIRHADSDSIQPLPTKLFGTQELKSKIGSLSISQEQPFCSADLILDMAKAYIYKMFDRKRHDPLDDHQITINEGMLKENDLLKINNKSFPEIIKDLFVPGLWMCDNSSMVSVLNILLGYKRFITEIEDILNLSTVTQLVYDNQLASIIIGPLILSYLNEWILDTCNKEYPLNLFSPYTYICDSRPSGNRIAKLCDMVISMCYISNEDYAQFVNNTMWQFQNLIITNPIIQQPYVKGLKDWADIYAIGGCELYNYAKFSNPLVRGYGWITCVEGTSEQLETTYQWLYGLQNNSLMELLEQSVNNPDMVSMNLQIQWTKLYVNKTFPNLLSNYSFSNGEYKLKGYPYVVDYKTSDGRSIISLILSCVFPRSNIREAIPPVIVFKPITYENGVVTAYKAVENGMAVVDSGNEVINPARMNETGLALRCPLYDFNGEMEDNKVEYVTPGGYRLETLYLISTRHTENQTILVFTNAPRITRFQNYIYNRNDFAPGTSSNVANQYAIFDGGENDLTDENGHVVDLENDNGIVSNENLTFGSNASNIYQSRADPREKRRIILSGQQVVDDQETKEDKIL